MTVSPTSPMSASKTPSECATTPMLESVLLDAAGHRRSPATMPSYHHGRAPRNKGLRYPADPPTIDEIIAVMRGAGDRADGHRLRASIVLLWRAGLRISEALGLAETDLDQQRGAVPVRRGKGGRRREVGMDRWAWDHSSPGSRSGLAYRSSLCYASAVARPVAVIGSRRLPASSCGERLWSLVSGVGSRRTRCGTPTPSRWRTKAFPSSSSSANSDMPISASHRSTCTASIAARSSTPSTRGPSNRHGLSHR
jgi:hypothetical protein